MKKTDKFNYITGKQITDPDTGKRVYEVDKYRLPSVTTILGQTKDQSFIKKWKEKVGEAKAEEIKNLSSKRGTSMHKFLESYIEGVGYDDLTDIGVQAKPMAQKIIEIGLAPVDEWYGSEVTLHYPGLYAGSLRTLYVGIMAWILSLTLNKQISQKIKTGLMIITYK